MTKQRPVRAAIVLSIVALWLGCESETLSDETPDVVSDLPSDPETSDTVIDSESGDSGPLVIERLELITPPWNPLARYVEWSLSREATIVLSVVCEGGDPSIRWEGRGTEAAVFVFGFFDGARCTAVLEATDAIVTVDEQVAFGVEGIVEAPEIEVIRYDVGVPQDGWNLLGLNNQFDDQPFTLALVDSQGRYRWLHRVRGAPGSDNEITIRPEGVLVGGTRNEINPQLIGWDGTELWRREIYMHHDIRHLGDRIVYLVHEDSCEWSEKGAGVVEWSLEEDRVVWEYFLCEDLHPENPAFDWAHINTVEPLLGGDYLISPRNLNTIYRLDRETGTLRWGLGQMGDFEMDEDAVFWRQHAPEILENGHVLLFDNGLRPRRSWSRAAEYRLDFETMRAELVWDYTPEPPLYASIMGDADRLPNGNTLITFGQRSETEITRIIEVDAESREVWELRPEVRWGSYRADRVDVPQLAWELID